MRIIPLFVALTLAAGTAAAQQAPTRTKGPSVTRAPFGHTKDGTPVEIYTLENARGMKIRVMTYGGIIQQIMAPDREGHLADVVLGFDSLEGYVKESPYFGAIVGRYANRIAHGQFTLDGKTYHLPINNGPNSLHGGLVGFDKVVWHAEPFTHGDSVGLVLTHSSPNGDQGYPGDLHVRVTYTLTPMDEIVVDYHATTDKATPINVSQHSYFNLKGEGNGDILGHILTIHASHYTPIDSTFIPTGQIESLEGSPLNFEKPTAIGKRINEPNQQLVFAHGYDHNYVLDRTGPGMFHAVHVLEPTTGRTLDVYTTQPGLQFYSGNFLDGTIHGKSGHVYVHRGGFCLETQHYPDSPNHANFPSTILRPGETFHQVTVFKFGVKE